MLNKATVFFNHHGYILIDNNEVQSLLTTKIKHKTPEDKLRKAWFYLGRGLHELLIEKYETIIIISDTKVIDQLEGVIIDDADCLAMATSIKQRGLTKFLHYELRKVTTKAIEDKFNEAKRTLRGMG